MKRTDEEIREARRATNRAQYVKNREARIAAAKAYYEANRDEVRASRAKHYAEHRDEIRERDRKRYQRDRVKVLEAQRISRQSGEQRAREHGLTAAEVQAMLDRQGGKCAICRLPMKRICIDHDHATGQVRGLLCHNCNVALGHFRDSAPLLRAAADYVDWFHGFEPEVDPVKQAIYAFHRRQRAEAA